MRAYVGPSAFAHKGGLHSSAVLKDPRTYEHVPPEAVGNARVIPVSDQAGRSNLLARLAEAGIDLDAKDARVARLLEDVKQREFLGYAYDGAEASFELLARRALGQVPDYFDGRELPRHGGARAAMRDGELRHRLRRRGEAEGRRARRCTMSAPATARSTRWTRRCARIWANIRAFLADLRLVDYKVRILTSGTEAVTRVMVESADGKGNRWSTVGVSANIVDASFEALTDSIIYKLYRDGRARL